jgi:hypothetical protein
MVIASLSFASLVALLAYSQPDISCVVMMLAKLASQAALVVLVKYRYPKWSVSVLARNVT